MGLCSRADSPLFHYFDHTLRQAGQQLRPPSNVLDAGTGNMQGRDRGRTLLITPTATPTIAPVEKLDEVSAAVLGVVVSVAVLPVGGEAVVDTGMLED